MNEWMDRWMDGWMEEWIDLALGFNISTISDF